MKSFNRVLHTALLLVAVTSLCRAQQVTSEYDRFHDETVTKLEKTRVAGTDDDHALYLMLTYTVPSKEQPGAKPHTPMLSLFSISPTIHFSVERELIFLVDGERLKLGQMLLIDVQPGKEWIMTALPIDALLRIARAKKVEARVADWEFTFNASQMKALRAFLLKTDPGNSL